MGQTSPFSVTTLVSAQYTYALGRHQCSSENETAEVPCAWKQGDENMLGIIAAVLIVLWLFGFFAFHVTTALIHVLLVLGLVLLVVHFMRGSPARV